MLKKGEIGLKLSAFLVLTFIGFLTASEIKLRIYLQDGTLQTGNLVAETDDQFVILNREGRVEVKKDKIMFINGKTLKQWQERPDKLFQTEIIPDNIPDPSYVNNKAELPPAPVIKPVEPLKKALPPAEPPPTAQAESAASKPIEKPAVKEPPASTPIAAPKAPVPAASTSAAEKPVEKPVVKEATSAAVAKPVEAVPVAAVVPKQKSKRAHPAAELPAKTASAREKPPVAPSAVDKPAAPPVRTLSNPAIAPPARFVRKDFGDYHYQRALAFLNDGEQGRAIQELHIATTLDRQNGDSVLLLGKLYAGRNMKEKADKYLSHPLVRKREDVKKMREDLDSALKSDQRHKWILCGATAAGALAWIPLLVVWSRFRKPKARVITAETMESPALETIDERKPAQMPSPIPPTPLPPVEPVAPAVPPAPVRMASEPPMAFPPSAEPIVPPTLPPPPVAPPVPPPLPVAETPAPPPPVPIPYASALDAESMLRLASMVEKAVRRGNAYAVESKFDLARREYRTALALNSICPEAYVGMGYLAFCEGLWDVALDYYVKALEIEPNSADAHYGIGRALLESERIDEAITEFQKALALDPSFDDARETLTSLGATA